MTISLLTASNLQEKFIEEQEYINRYVNFLQYKTAIFESEIRDLVNLLEKYGFSKIEHKRDWTLWNTSLSYDELDKLNEQIQPLLPELKRKIQETERILAAIEEPKEWRKVDVRSMQGELVDYFLNNLEDDFSTSKIENARRELIEQIQVNQRELLSGEESLI